MLRQKYFPLELIKKKISSSLESKLSPFLMNFQSFHKSASILARPFHAADYFVHIESQYWMAFPSMLLP